MLIRISGLSTGTTSSDMSTVRWMVGVSGDILLTTVESSIIFPSTSDFGLEIGLPFK